MSKVATVPNIKCRRYVEEGLPFRNNNGTLWGNWYHYDTRDDERLYIVYSYGEHWPLFIYSETLKQWFGNEDKYSRTTAKHRTYAMPHGGVGVEWRDSRTMKEIANNGLVGAVRKQFREAA